MKKTAIAERRAKALQEFAEKIGDYSAAKTIINRYYRVCAAEQRLLILENDKRTADSRYTALLCEKCDKMRAGLKKIANAYGLIVVYYSHLPTITTEIGGNNVFETFFYNN